MKLNRIVRSALRLPGRLGHVARVARDIAYWAITFQLRAGLRRREHARLIRRSALFDVPFYLAQCPDDRAARADPYTHYLVIGARRGLEPAPLFDGAAYLARNPTAARENPLVHYLLSERACAAPAPEQRPAPAPPRAADPGEALLLAHPFPAARDGTSPRRVLVIGPEAPHGANRVAELLRKAGEIGSVTFVSADVNGANGGAGVLRGFAAALAHLEDEGHQYVAVIACGVEQTSRYLAPVRAYAPQAVLVCDATGPFATAMAGDAGGKRERVARVVTTCSDVVWVSAAADREAILRLAPGAHVEAIPRGGAALAGLSSRVRRSEERAEGLA